MLINFASEEGTELIKSTDYVNWEAIESYFPQDNPFYCGVASLKTVINASRLQRDGFITCDDVFCDKVNEIRTRQQVVGKCESNTPPGIELEDFYQISQTLFKEVNLTPIDEAPEHLLIDDLNTNFNNSFWIFNFYGPILGIKAKGHYAVLGAWHNRQKKLLMLDPARHQDGWYWVGIDKIIQSMEYPRESCSRGRGYIKIFKNTPDFKE